MAILKRCLIPEIQNGLGDSFSSPALYSQALKELESTYGLLSLISRTYFQSVIQLQRVNQNDHKALKFSPFGDLPPEEDQYLSCILTMPRLSVVSIVI